MGCVVLGASQIFPAGVRIPESKGDSPSRDILDARDLRTIRD